MGYVPYHIHPKHQTYKNMETWKVFSIKITFYNNLQGREECSLSRPHLTSTLKGIESIFHHIHPKPQTLKDIKDAFH
jgi:hypothetical protein